MLRTGVQMPWISTCLRFSLTFTRARVFPTFTHTAKTQANPFDRIKSGHAPRKLPDSTATSRFFALSKLFYYTWVCQVWQVFFRKNFKRFFYVFTTKNPVFSRVLSLLPDTRWLAFLIHGVHTHHLGVGPRNPTIWALLSGEAKECWNVYCIKKAGKFPALMF